MAQSETDIANYALALLGSKRITDIADDTSKNARIMELHYDQARQELLRSHRWNFALLRASLTAHADAPEYGYSYQYPLPADFLRLCEVNEVNVWESVRADWFEIEQGKDAEDAKFGKALLTNESTIRIRYVADLTDTTQFDPLFTQALTVLLASKAGRAITGSDAIAQNLREQYEGVDLPRARQVDGAETSSNENPPIIDAMSRSYFVRSRGVGGVVYPLGPDNPANYPSP